MLRTPARQAARSRSSPIAHLGDAERMFFVSLLLNETARVDARAVRHHEPARHPLHGRDLRLLPAGGEPAVEAAAAHAAQAGARASASACVLATQNPVDLDYKGLSNTGTWFIGRLRTERDKARLLDGSRGRRRRAPASALDREQMKRRSPASATGIFLMSNVTTSGVRQMFEPMGAVVPSRAAHAQPDQHADGGSRAPASARLRPDGGRATRRPALAPVSGRQRASRPRPLTPTSRSASFPIRRHRRRPAPR